MDYISGNYAVDCFSFDYSYFIKKIIQICAEYVAGNADTIYFDKAYNLYKDTDFIDFYESIRYDIERDRNIKIKTISDFRKYIWK